MADRFKQMLKDTVFVVEATSFEHQKLWEQFSDKSLYKTELNKYKWEQLNPGYLETVAEFHGYPVNISCQWARINGLIIMFYAAGSRVVDRDKIEKWFKHNCNPTYDNGRLAHCDANNFHQVLDFIDENSRAV